jgi:hypothetical protein
MADDHLRDDTLELLGLLAFFELSEMGEVLGEPDPAQPVAGRLAQARRAGRALERSERVLAEIDRLGGSGLDEMARFDGVFDDFDVRTVASTAAESVLRDYVGRTVAEDFCRVVAAGAEPAARDVVIEVAGVGRVDEALVQAVADAAAADPVLSARLALWGRRLVGEALRLVQGLLVERASFARLAAAARAADAPDAEPAVAADPAPEAALAAADPTAVWILRRITERHAERMRRLGLAA